jgi:hypothetical protein
MVSILQACVFFSAMAFLSTGRHFIPTGYQATTAHRIHQKVLIRFFVSLIRGIDYLNTFVLWHLQKANV